MRIILYAAMFRVRFSCSGQDNISDKKECRGEVETTIQNRQCVCEVTLKHGRSNIVTVEKR